MTKNFNRGEWVILSNHCGGWFAWNHLIGQKVQLVFYGAFSKAVTEFERRLGPYYGPGEKEADTLGDE